MVPRLRRPNTSRRGLTCLAAFLAVFFVGAGRALAALPGAIEGRVAVGSVEVRTDNQWVDHRKLTSEALQESLTRLGLFTDVVPMAKVAEKTPAVPSEEELYGAVKSLGADYVVRSVVRDVVENPQTGQVYVETETRLLDARSRDLVGWSMVRGASTQKLGGFKGDKSLLVQEAAFNAAEHAVREIKQSVKLTGTVSIANTRDNEVVFITLAEVNTVKAGSFVGIYDENGEKIAHLEVADAGIAQVSGTLRDRKPGATVRPGMSVRVEYIPSTTFEEFKTVAEKFIPKKKKGGGSLMGILGLGAVAVLLGIGHNKKDAASGEQAKIVGKVSCSNCAPGAAGASVTIPSTANNVVQPTISQASSYPPLPSSQFINQASSVFDFKPDGLQFNTNVTLSLGYKDDDKNGCVDGRTDVNDVTVTDGDAVGCVNITSLQLYTFDPNQQLWVPVETSSTVTSGSDTRVTAPVNHFSFYVILENEAPEPPDSPRNPSISCTTADEGTLLWTASNDPNVRSYNVYECTSLTGGCGTSPIATGLPVNPPRYVVGGFNATDNRYFAVSAVDLNGQESAKSVIAVGSAAKCRPVTTPILVVPANGDRIQVVVEDNEESQTTNPTLAVEFVFKGHSDNQNGYLLEVFHISLATTEQPLEVKTLFNATQIESAGAGTSANSESVEVVYKYIYQLTGPILNQTFEWRVCNLDASDSCITDDSPAWTSPNRFKVASANLEQECKPEDFGTPAPVSPADGSVITFPEPMFQWGDVLGADTYEITVKNPSGALVWSEITTGVVAVFDTSVNTLNNGTTYSWTVKARGTGGCESTSDAFFFKKEDPNDVEVRPNPPVWAAAPITGGNQLAVLRWLPNASGDNVTSYMIYRLLADGNGTVDLASFQNEQVNILTEVQVSQLNAVSSNPNCPQSTQQAPVFCDESVTNGRKYFYVLRAKSTNDQLSLPSGYESIQLGLQRPVLVSPGGVLPIEFQVQPGGQTVNFVIQTVNGAESYLVEVFDETDNRMVEQSAVSAEAFSLGFTQFDQHVYRWQVKALNSQVTSEVSTPLKFKVVFVDEGAIVPAVEQLVGVPDSIKRTVTLTWNKVNDASVTKYQILRSVDQNPSNFDVVGELPQVTATTLTFVDEGLTGDTTYYYKVFAITSTGGQSPDPTGGPVKAKIELVAPFYENPPNFSNIADAQPTLAWTPVSGAVRYLVQVAKVNQEFTSEDNIIWSAVTDDTSIQFGDPAFPAPTSELANNPCQSGCARDAHKWRVGAIGNNTTTAVFRTPILFYKYLPNPVPVTPLGQGTNVTNLPQFTDPTPLLQWKAVSGAVNYIVRVCEGSGKCGKGKNILWESTVAITSVDYNADTTGQALKNCAIVANVCTDGIGIYTWQVRAVDANGVISDLDWEQDSSVPYNTFVKVSPAPPTLLIPAEDEIVLPDPNDTCFDPEDPTSCTYNVKYVWGSSVGASNYIIRVREEDNEGNFTVIWQATVGCCEVDFAGGGSLRPLKAGTRYTWNVAAVVSGEDAAVEFASDNERGFVTGVHFPVPNTPVDNSLAILNDGKLTVNFTWAKVAGATAYDIEILNVTQNVNLTSINTDPDKKCNPLGAAQVGNYLRVNLPTFICTVATSVVGPFDGDVIRWKVRAVDSLTVPNATGNPGPWSETRLFKVGVNGPVLASPPNSAEGVTDPAQMQWILYRDTPFYWSPIPDDPAARYLFVVSDDPSFLNVIWVQQGTATPATVPFNITTGQNGTPVVTGYTPHISGLRLPMVNGVTYYWRAAACPSGIAAAGDCGDRNAINWIYSPTFRVYKRPQGVDGVGTAVVAADATGQNYTVTLSWDPPKDFNGDVATPDSSVPAIPPTAGGYVVSNTCTGIENGVLTEGISTTDNNTTQVTFSYACGSTDTYLCVQVMDDSRLAGYIGATSPIATVPFSIPACPEATP